MTVRELYKFAKKRKALDYQIEVYIMDLDHKKQIEVYPDFDNFEEIVDSDETIEFYTKLDWSENPVPNNKLAQVTDMSRVWDDSFISRLKEVY